MAPAPAPAKHESTPLLRDTRVLSLLWQAALVAVLVVVGAWLINNLRANLAASNIPIGWSFLRQSAGFEISEGAAWDPSQSFARAFLVGVGNTLRVVLAGIVLATIVGLVAGIARLSANWLVRTLAGIYVETIRNTPLLVQLFFWYTAVILPLPSLDEGLRLGNFLIISNRGVAMGWPYVTETGGAWLWWLLGALMVSWLVWRWRRSALDKQGRLDSALPVFFGVFLLVAVVGYFVVDATSALPAGVTYELRRGDRGTLFVDADGNAEYDAGVDRPIRRVPVELLGASGASLGLALTEEDGGFRFFAPTPPQEEGDAAASAEEAPPAEEGVEVRYGAPPPVVYSAPVVQGFNVRGGRTFSPEFAALLLGLTLYTGAFISEIVRSGINAVPKGQWEAARAVGLSGGATLRLIVLPQALRVIIPPLTSQYLNLAKNSSLAIAVGYPDLFNISLTIMGQSGATVQLFLVIMATYLSFSLLTSLIMNIYNQRIALVER